jgi:hypothetical protein
MRPLQLLPLLSLAFAGISFIPARAEIPATPSAIQVQRADKIAASLGLTDAAQSARVRDLIARQYLDLSIIHSARDAAIHAAKASAETDKAASDVAIKQAKADAEAAQDRLHPAYLARLAAELTPAQIEQVKDGMTYGVLPLTFRVYQEMLPNLTADQKAQILAWLTEAREHAMDASTSDEKHAWFGKYKGRINNYLAKAGIDMKQAEKDLQARRKNSATK